MGSFAENLRRAMQEKEMTQAELSKRTGISKSFISQYLSGKFKPRDDKLTLLAAALGTTKGALLGYETAGVVKIYETNNLIRVPVFSADEPDKMWDETLITAEPGEYIFYICRNDKHRPFVMHGDYLLVAVGEISGAGLYAVRREGGARVHFHEYEDPRKEAAGLNIIGRVCQLRRKL